MKKKIRLGVNIDHAATLRQVRGGITSYPSVMEIAEQARLGGADQITIHLREDRRHIQEKDLASLIHWGKLPLNLEMACTAEMLKKALKYKPDWVCYVPEKREELTTEGGLDVCKNKKNLAAQIERLQRIGIEVSMFIDADPKQIEASFDIGAEAVEFHTGHWVMCQGLKKKKAWDKLVAAALAAHQIGLQVHAGHGLEPKTTSEICKLPYLEELNIGHFLICDSLIHGLKTSVRNLKKIL